MPLKTLWAIKASRKRHFANIYKLLTHNLPTSRRPRLAKLILLANVPFHLTLYDSQTPHQTNQCQVLGRLMNHMSIIAHDIRSTPRELWSYIGFLAKPQDWENLTCITKSFRNSPERIRRKSLYPLATQCLVFDDETTNTISLSLQLPINMTMNATNCTIPIGVKSEAE